MRKLVWKPTCIFAICLMIFVGVAESGVIGAAVNQDAKKGNIESSSLESELFEVEELLSSLELNTAEKGLLLKGIPVESNALGDLDQNGYFDLKDLLRLRNIVLSIGDPASPYEEVEADFNLDMTLDMSDLMIARDALVRFVGVPHTIDSSGGIIEGVGVEISIPAGCIGDSEVITASKIPPDTLLLKHGIDVEAETAEENYLFGTYSINTLNGSGFKKDFDISVELDSIPPCEFQGGNYMLRIFPDMDGDGRSELSVGNLMKPSADSTKIVATAYPDPVISVPTKVESYEPGQMIEIYASNLPMRPVSIAIVFVGPSQDTISVYPTDLIYQESAPDEWEVTGVRVITPYTTDIGLTEITIINIATGGRSINMEINVVNVNQILDSPIDTLEHFFLLLDSMVFHMLNCDSLNTLYPPIASYLENELPIHRQEFDAIKTDIINGTSDYAEFAGVIVNANVLDSLRGCIALFESFSYVNTDINFQHSYGISTAEFSNVFWSFALTYSLCMHTVVSGLIFLEYNYTPKLIGALCIGIIIGGVAVLGWYLWDRHNNADNNQDNDGSYHDRFNIDDDGTFSGNGVQGGVGGGGNKSGGRHTEGCCINIFNYGHNLMGGAGGPSGGGGGCSGGGSGGGDKSTAMLPVELLYNSLQGAIVAPANVSAPYGIVSVINAAGTWIIPHLPLNTDVTFSIYDPETGLYDSDVATVHTSSTPGLFGEVIAYFDPDTSVCIFPLSIGDIVYDSVSDVCPKTELSLYIGSGYLGDTLSFKYYSVDLLTLWFQDPSGDFIVRDSSINCENYYHFEIVETGTYKISVSYGSTGGSGAFAVGTSIYPAPASPYLCGQLPEDTLRSGYFSYIIMDAPFVASGDTLILEPDIEIEFDVGGSLSADGTMKATTTSDAPIILRPYSQTTKSGNMISDQKPNEIEIGRVDR